MGDGAIVTDQTVLFLILGTVFGLLLWGRVRYDCFCHLGWLEIVAQSPQPT